MFLVIGLAHGQSLAPYVAHEWGTFTTISGQDGVALDWQPLAQESDLPSFVYTLEDYASGRGLRNLGPCVTKGCSAPVRMETPVIYFHAEEPVEVSVRVTYRGGSITEWYPHASSVYGEGLRWGRITIDPTASPTLPTEPADSHYYPARNVDSSPVAVCDLDETQWEQFLFYRGVGTRTPRLQAWLGDGVHVVDAGVERVWVVHTEGAEMSWSEVRVVEGEAFSAIPTTGDVAGLTVALQEAAVDAGLYEDEAAAMLDTWDDTWFEEGTRVLYLLEDREVQRMIPLSLDPEPAELVRVLVGRVELAGPLAELGHVRLGRRR